MQKEAQSKLIADIRDSVYSLMASILGQSSPELGTNLKSDDSLVTRIDIEVGQRIKELAFEYDELKHFTFFSEEDHPEGLKFPAIILDPIDGTRELVKGIPECAIGLSFLVGPELDSPGSFSWILNPFTGIEIASSNIGTPLLDRGIFNPTKNRRRPLLGMISRNEWEKIDQQRMEKYLRLREQLALIPMGSIVHKLALLALGANDFVISYSPKNIWDIGAGSHLLALRGFHFYEQGKRVTRLDKERYLPPLLWCRGEYTEDLSKNLY